MSIMKFCTDEVLFEVYTYQTGEWLQLMDITVQPIGNTQSFFCLLHKNLLETWVILHKTARNSKNYFS